MKKKLLALILLLVATSSLGACQTEKKIDFVDYDFKEYTEPPTQKQTEKITENTSEKSTVKSTEKSTEKSTANTTQVPTQKPTENTTKKKINQETVVNNKPSEEPTEQQTTYFTPQMEPNPNTEPPTQAPTQAPTQPPEVKAEDIRIVYKDRLLELDTPFDAVIGTFGTPDSSTSLTSDEFSGEKYLHQYGNMSIHTYVLDGVEKIESIRVDGAGEAKTTRGIKVGSSLADIKKLYGKPTSEDTVILKYKVNNQYLIFYLANDRTTVSGFSIVKESSSTASE